MSGAAPGLTAVVVMAKAPRPGQVKTRLIPALGAAGAAALAARMLQHMLAQARAAQIGPVWLCGAPRGDDPAFGALGEGLARMDQGEGDLGARMSRALATRLAAGPAAVPQALVVGTDCPALDAGVLRAAAAALAGHDTVLVPALDGGYVLLGLRADRQRLLPVLFDAMPWSTPGLLAATRARLAAAGAHLAELPALADVDEPQDLQHLPAGWLPASGRR